MSWFSGKKFRRVRCENFQELLNSPNATEQMIRLLDEHPPILSFNRIDDVTFNFFLQSGDKHFAYTFKLGEEHVLDRRDGCKIKIVYHLLSDNTMKQTVKMPDGKTAYFTREFSKTETKMTVQLEGSDIKGTVYYEVVE